jgi:PAS domain-containing protein
MVNGSISIGQAYAWRVAERRQKHLILILARELVSNLATPALITDEGGRVVFYNEAAEPMIGGPFAELGEMALDQLAETYSPRTLEGQPMPSEGMPGRIALDERRAAHERLRITSRDGVDRVVSVTAFPLFAHADEFVGIVVIFWRE